MKFGFRKFLVSILVMTVAAVSVAAAVFADEAYPEENAAYAEDQPVNEASAVKDEIYDGTPEDIIGGDDTTEFTEESEEEPAEESTEEPQEEITEEPQEEITEETITGYSEDELIADPADSDPGQEDEAAVTEAEAEDAELKVSEELLLSDIIRSITVDTVYINEGNRDHTYSDYAEYMVFPETVIIETIDDFTYVENINDIVWDMDYYYGIDCYDYEIITDQSATNIWGAGRHTATLSLGDVTVDFDVIITESPIAEVKVLDSDIVLLEGMKDYTVYYQHDGTLVRYGYYPIFNDLNISVTTYDGNTYSGKQGDVYFEIADAYGEYYDYFIETDQSPYNTWEAGIHEAELYFGGKKATFNVTVIENPFESLYIEDRTVAKNDCYEYTWQDYSGDEITYREYFAYPEQMTLTAKSGKTYSGYKNEIYEKVMEDYDFSSIVMFTSLIDEDGYYFQGYDLSPGSYELTYNMLGVSGNYTFTLSDEPIPDGFNYIPVRSSWGYYQNEKLKTGWTGVANGTINGSKAWYYISSGIYDPSAKGICKRADGFNNTWYYVLNGKLEKKTGIAQRVDGSNKTWYFVKNGVFTRASGIAQRADGSNKTWYYVKNGVFTKATGICKRADGSNKTWYYVKNGVFTKATCIAKKADGSGSVRYYVKGGLFTKYTGTLTISGKKYKLVKGLVK